MSTTVRRLDKPSDNDSLASYALFRPFGRERMLAPENAKLGFQNRQGGEVEAGTHPCVLGRAMVSVVTATVSSPTVGSRTCSWRDDQSAPAQSDDDPE